MDICEGVEKVKVAGLKLLFNVCCVCSTCKKRGGSSVTATILTFGETGRALLAVVQMLARIKQGYLVLRKHFM